MRKESAVLCIAIMAIAWGSGCSGGAGDEPDSAVDAAMKGMTSDDASMRPDMMVDVGGDLSGVDLSIEDASGEDGDSDLSAPEDQGVEMDPDLRGGYYTISFEADDELNTCGDVCAALGYVCDGMYSFGPWMLAGRSLFNQKRDFALMSRCDVLPPQDFTDFGTGEVRPFEGYECYCKP